LKESANFQNND
jgi:hypothetical protein